jgi:hypothetical protein
MKKDYQTRTTAAVTTVGGQLPDAVSVTLTELAAHFAKACWPWPSAPDFRSWKRSSTRASPPWQA